MAQGEREVRPPTPLFPDAGRRAAGSAGFGPGGREAEEDREGAFPAAAMAGAGRQATGRLFGRASPHAAYSPGLAQRLAPEPAVAPSDPFNLSPREREVLGVLAEGCTNREIAHRLFISERTVAVHVGNILAKLGASGRVEAAMVALRLGLVPSTPPATVMSALARPAPLAAATRSMHPSVIPGASQSGASRWGTLPAPARARTDQARPAGKPRL
jgi:DNA-binding CsgD family transcriptional regulator